MIHVGNRGEVVYLLDNSSQIEIYPKSECDILFDTNEYPNIFVKKNDTNEYPNIFVSKKQYERISEYICIKKMIRI